MFSKLFWPILLQVLGIVVVIAEFVLPSMGLLMVVAIGLFGYSIYLVFTHVSVMAGITFSAVDACLIPILVIIGIKMLAASPVTLRNTLSSKDGTFSQPPEWANLVGVSGAAVTDLRPAGAALINSKRYDVVSRGDFITKGSPVIVLSVEGNRIVVKKTDIT